ncbi:MAG: TlpA disulfide reductase family protein [Nitriliruptor sp.]
MSRLVALLATLALATAACSGGASAADCERLPGVRPGLCPIAAEDREPAPERAVPVLGDETAERSVADLAGAPAVLNFWGSWCGPCRTEQPELNQVAERFEGRVGFLGVNVDDPTPNALAFVREFDVPYGSVHDPAGSYAAAFGGIGPSVMPSTLLLDERGRVAVRLFGSTDETELTVLLDLLLEEGQGG